MRLRLIALQHTSTIAVKFEDVLSMDTGSTGSESNRGLKNIDHRRMYKAFIRLHHVQSLYQIGSPLRAQSIGDT